MQIIDIVFGLYVIYMFNFFTTNYRYKFSWNSLFTRNSSFLNHEQSIICPLGNLVGWIFGLFLIFKSVILNNTLLERYIVITCMILISFVSLLLNFDAFLYIQPVWLLLAF